MLSRFSRVQLFVTLWTVYTIYVLSMVTVSLPELVPHLQLGGRSRFLPESLGFGCFQLKIFTCQRDTCWWQVLFPYNFYMKDKLSLYMKDKLTAYPVNE